MGAKLLVQWRIKFAKRQLCRHRPRKFHRRTSSSERIEAWFSDAVVISKASFITNNYVTFGRAAHIQTQEAVPIRKDSTENRMSSLCPASQYRGLLHSVAYRVLGDSDRADMARLVAARGKTMSLLWLRVLGEWISDLADRPSVARPSQIPQWRDPCIQLPCFRHQTGFSNWLHDITTRR
jgi:hypothetical protein